MTNDIEVLKAWLQICAIIASIGSTMVPILYSFSAWRSRRIGRLFMLQAVSFAFALNITTLFSFWTPSNILVIFWVEAIMFTAIAGSTSSLAISIWKMNHPKKKEEHEV